MDKVLTADRAYVRSAYDEWREAIETDDRDKAELHRAWVDVVLERLLEFDESMLLRGEAVPPDVVFAHTETESAHRPDMALVENGRVRLILSILPPDADPAKPPKGDRWAASPLERTVALCREKGIRLGLVTDGERWTLVDAPVGGTATLATWYARLWFQETATLQAFRSLLSVRRFYGPEEDRLDALLTRSLEERDEVSDTLGEQVRRAVEVLVQSVDRADADRNRTLLESVSPTTLYEAGLTTMMRLVFLLCAEERGLLAIGEPIYDRFYAVSTLRAQLEEEADKVGQEVLERRHDAWSRLLATFRAVYCGIEHPALLLPPLGGSLFDPDRYPFLEGRSAGTHWRETPAAPLPIDNRTVLLLLRALQVLERKEGAQNLSYRSLDVEQIGHVYEGLLEFTVKRLPDATLGLTGSSKVKAPNATLAELEALGERGDGDLVAFLVERTTRTESALRKDIARPVDDGLRQRLATACGGDTELLRRVLPFAHLLRSDIWDVPMIYRAGSFAVVLGADRRETGTHYTPKSLTETIVADTLTPVAYIGPAEGTPREEWRLKPPAELLDLKVCDVAVGSGAFLVQACRWLGERICEAWMEAEATGDAVAADGVVHASLDSREALSTDPEERLVVARRLVAERCLYGVDMNPLALELAKLSLWLVTLSKGRPFGFLDHNLRSGDSLLGIHRLDQLTHLTPKPGPDTAPRLFAQNVETVVNQAIELRTKLRAVTIRDIHDVETMAAFDRDSRAVLDRVELVADALMGETVRHVGSNRGRTEALDSLSLLVGEALDGDEARLESLRRLARTGLDRDLPEGRNSRYPFHWPLEFPEVFANSRNGFDAIIGNPPYVGGQRISGATGGSYREFLVEQIADGFKGSADLVAYFFLRIIRILRTSGTFGLLSTNTIAQGDTREVGLDRMLTAGTTLYKADPSFKWPGKANLEVAITHGIYGRWRAQCNLAGRRVNTITAFLDDGTASGKAFRLKDNAGKSFIGSYVLGMGFVMEPDQVQALVAKNHKNADVLSPYLNGDDLNSRPDQSPSRWVINFKDWPLTRENNGRSWKMANEKERKQFLRAGIVPSDYPDHVAADYPDCLEIVKRLVKPERDKNTFSKSAKEKWWLYERTRPELYETIGDLQRVLIHPLTSKHHNLVFFLRGMVYSHMTVVFPISDWKTYAVMQSELHWDWVLKFGNKLETRPQYTPSDCFETFPFPRQTDSQSADLESIGETYYTHRNRICTTHKLGLTSIYNLFHDRTCIKTDIAELRLLHTKMDYAVCDAYGWSELDLRHDFYGDGKETRYTLHPDAKAEVLRRLLKLNHERHEEELAAEKEIADSAPKKTTKRMQKTSGAQPSLPNTGRDRDNGSAALFQWLEDHPGLHSRDAVLSGAGLAEAQWKPAIDHLLAEGKIERQGEKRGAKYRTKNEAEE